VLANARQMGITTMLDTAWDAKDRWLKLLEPCLYHLDYFMPSLEEAQMLSGKEKITDVADFFTYYGIANIILKLGAQGCYVKTAAAEFPVPAFPIKKVVSALGAGDAFVAGFIAGIISGYDLKKACHLANAVGAACVSAEGYAGIKPLGEILRKYLGET
jgi:sugar/nucleoside kinase (ribokinase family)